MTSPTTLVEPFAAYAARGDGIPYLEAKKKGKVMHVQWSDGVMFHYPEFHDALDAEAMDAALVDVFVSNKDRLSRSAELCHGGWNGCLLSVPHGVGLEAFEVVRVYFTRALEKVAQHVGTTPRGAFLEKDAEKYAGSAS